MGSARIIMKLVALVPWLLIAPLLVASAPQYRQRLQRGQRGRGRGGGPRSNTRQNKIGRRLPAIPDDYDDVEEYVAPAKYSEEQPTEYGSGKSTDQEGRRGSAEIRDNAERAKVEETE